MPKIITRGYTIEFFDHHMVHACRYMDWKQRKLQVDVCFYSLEKDGRFKIHTIIQLLFIKMITKICIIIAK